ncbi:MAG: deoxyribodipyrimidine photo-lyase, partial [Anaerolineaceae bacterium]|nr:deoxyribodipyrimidine photo-lyase [Anaerolineaceae bacterium]
FSDHILSAPTALPPLPEIYSDPIPDFHALQHIISGEQEAHKRLQHFLDGPVIDYEVNRNAMAVPGTSSLSPYLRFGMLSVKQAIVAARKKSGSNQPMSANRGSEIWINELIWREFYQSILYHFPHVLSTAFNPSFRDIQWRNEDQDLQAWKAGMTGYPVVDAGMRQMAATGWMHNRSRMITASFLVKHLLINWQEGERWFMEMLVDGDPAANNGGWQWVAGTGTDAAPYFRIFNPILQGKKFDSLGNYVRQWVPELNNIPQKFIHTPWEMTDSEQQACGVTIGKDYPNPIVDHGFARQRVLAAYAKK